jgi:hypothetical protein
MTFEEVERKLPNGFHDAKIRSISADFINRSITLGMDLHAGTPADPDPERYRPGTLSIASLCLFFIEPPDPRYPFVSKGSPLNVDGDSVKVGQSPQVDRLLPILPANVSVYRFFLEEWNSFLYLGGDSVLFSWDAGEAFT